MGQQAASRIREEIRALPATELGWASVAERSIEAIERAVPADAWCVAAVDPSTLFMTRITGNHLGDDLRHFFELEYTKHDYLRQIDLASTAPHVGSLVVSTDGRPEQSVRWRDLLDPFGYHDQLRGALVGPAGCWGFFSMVREKGGTPYSPAEVSMVSSLVRYFAEAVRVGLLAEEADRGSFGSAPALVVLSEDLTVVDASEGAAAILGSVLDVGEPPPAEVLAIATRARDISLGNGSADDRPARATVHSGRGWYRAEAIPLTASELGRYVVLVEPLRPSEWTELRLKARGLTAREREITRSVLTGKSTSEIAQTLCLSPLTVQQHLKAIFAKCDVGSRRELMASMFLQHLE